MTEIAPFPLKRDRVVMLRVYMQVRDMDNGYRRLLEVVVQAPSNDGRPLLRSYTHSMQRELVARCVSNRTAIRVSHIIHNEPHVVQVDIDNSGKARLQPILLSEEAPMEEQY